MDDADALVAAPPFWGVGTAARHGDCDRYGTASGETVNLTGEKGGGFAQVDVVFTPFRPVSYGPIGMHEEVKLGSGGTNRAKPGI